jgi:IS5 family transposase
MLSLTQSDKSNGTPHMMIVIKRQRTLADDMVYGAVVSKEHLLYKINELADFSFVNREMTRFYHVKLGRIAIEPEILARAMVVQYLYNWSDRVCADMVANHITVKWFVGLGVEQPGFDFSLLSKHRKRLRENGQESMVFDAIVEQLIKAGYIGRKEKALMDATHLAADVAIPTVTRLLRDGIELMLEVMKQQARPLWTQAVDTLDLQAYLTEEQSREYLLDAQQKTARLSRTARDGWSLAKWLRDTMPSNAGERMEHTLWLLEKILADYVEPDNGGEPPPGKKQSRGRKGSRDGATPRRNPRTFKEKKIKGKGRIVSIVDEHARWGAKSDLKSFAGYKAHIIENENQVILDVTVTAGSVSDDAPVLDAVAKVENTFGIRIEKLTGDTKYGTGAIREALARKGAAVVAPLARPTNKKGFFTSDQFCYDQAADCVICPAGQRSVKKNRDNEKRCDFHMFAAQTCNRCEKKSKCTASANGRMAAVSDFRLLFAAAAQYNATAAYTQDMKRRAHIEPKNWELKQRHGMARVRYRGLDKVAQLGCNTAAVINLKRWVTLTEANQPSPNAPEIEMYAKVANS